MRKISESAWGDMMRRGSGENIRTEDDVNLLDLDGLYDYIKSKYEKRLFYLDKDTLGKYGRRNIVVDVIGNVSLFAVYDDEDNWGHILLSWSKVKIAMPFFDKLEERFGVENTNVCRRIITEKDGTCTNKTYIDVIDFFLDNMDNMLVTESAWGDMMRRGSGESIRTEDAVDHMDFDTFADYIKDNYSEKGNWFAIRESDDGISKHIEIDIIYGEEIDLSFNVVDGEIYTILVQGNKNYVDISGLKEIFNVNVLGSSKFSVVEKDWSRSNNTFVKLIEFYLNKKTNESAWGDMMRRGSGEEIRKEDDINHFGLEELCDYLRSNYESIAPYDTIYVDEEGDLTICLFEDTAGYLRYLYYDESHITTQKDVFELLDCERELKQKYWIQLKTNRFGFENVNIYPKNQVEVSMSNTFFIEVLDFILDRVDSPLKKQIKKKNNMNESAWGDMMRRGSGENTRKEEKVDNLTWDEFYDYLIDRYKYKKEPVNKIFKTNYSIDVPVFSGSHTTQLNITNRDTNRVSLFMHESDIRRGQDFENNLKLKYKIESQYIEKGWWSIYFKSKDDSFDMDLNSSFVELIDYILDMDKPFENIIEKVVNESAWGDMMRRGAGEEVREEDIDFLNSVKSDIRFFAIDIVYADLYKNSIDGFKEFMSKSYKNNFYDSKTHENVGKKMVKDIVIYVEANWNKGKNYESQVNEEINKEEEKVKKLGFVKEPGKSIEKTLNDWWDSYPYKEDLMNEVNLDLNGEEKYDDPDDMWNDSDYLTQIETYLKERINESAWGDMMRRGSGEQMRKEDEIPQELQKPLAAYIDMFASNATSGNFEYTVGSYPDFMAFVKDFMNTPRISCIDFNIDDLLTYITKDHYYDIIHPIILDTMDKINKSVDVAVDNIINSLKDQNMNESAWGDMMKRGSGEDNRIEDEILSDQEINSLNQFTLMYCRKERAHYIQNHIVPLPPSCRKENDYEGLIKYIEDRRDENLFTNVGDYNKIIRFINKNWDKLNMDKYIKKYIFSPDVMKGKKLLECEGVPGGATPANVGGMGAAYFPGPNGEPGSGDLPSPTGIVYHQVAPYTTFLKQIKKKKKKTKKFRKEDEPCVHSPNAKVYDYVDDFREYVDRTYNNMDRRR